MAAKKATTKKNAAGKSGGGKTAEDYLAMKGLPTLEFPVSTDTRLADARDEAMGVLADVNERVEQVIKVASFRKGAAGPSDELLDEQAEAKDAYEVAKAASDAVDIPFVMQALPRRAMINLYRDPRYRPTEKQKAKHKQDLKATGQDFRSLDFNEDTLPPVLICMAIKSPDFDQDQVDEMWFGPVCEDCGGEGCDDEAPTGDVCVDGRRPDLGVWSKAELDGLFMAARSVNNKIK